MCTKNKKLIYHLTALTNLKSILQAGLLSRNMAAGFTDIADSEIISFRKEHGLNDYVPFHFKSKNHFDGKVQKTYPEIEFIYITVSRKKAKQQQYKIIPCHPIACEPFQLYDYNEGFEMINWDLIDERDYHKQDCRNASLAECLTPNCVPFSDFSMIFCRNEATKSRVEKILESEDLSITVNVNKEMFVKK